LGERENPKGVGEEENPFRMIYESLARIPGFI